MRLGGIYNMEPLSNFHWGFMSLGLLRLYHYLVLQPLSFLTLVNLNSTMCPAISDPFNGPWYRLAANLHQTFFIFIHGKIYILIGNKFFVPAKDKERKIAIEQQKSEKLDANGNNLLGSSDDKTCSNCSSQNELKID